MEGKTLLKFYSYCDRLEFEEEPNYNKLRGYLLRQLSKVGAQLNNEYDWNIGFTSQHLGGIS
jgi:hypothetical protein